ncbi:MAG: RidA family protein [Chloroflexi bacterium]|nr:RidA family protein [Chloroflexota bacterium]
MMDAISTSEAPAAIGPYSQALRAGRFVFCSGQLGMDPASGELAAGTAAQAERALANVRAVLAAAGAVMDDVVRTTIFLADMSDFASVNEVYARHFRAPFPARSTVAVAALPRGGRVEIEVTALLPDRP